MVVAYGPRFSAVLPTYNREPALRENVSNFLALEGLSELVIVDDASTDGTWNYLNSLQDARLKLLQQPQNMGSPAARMAGVASASEEWILMLDDDCRVPSDYGRELLRIAELHGGSVISAPWIHAEEGQLAARLQAVQSAPVEVLTLSTHPSAFPRAPQETPFLPPLVMLHRDVMQSVSYSAVFRGNAWREETALFIAATKLGFKCVLTPTTWSHQTKRWGGGQQQRNRLHYEYWVARNNWIFLRQHGRWLQSHGFAHSPWVEQGTFLWSRLSRLDIPKRARTAALGALRRATGRRGDAQ